MTPSSRAWPPRDRATSWPALGNYKMAESAELKVKRCAPFALKLTAEKPYCARMSASDAYLQLLYLTLSWVCFPDEAEVHIEDLCARQFLLELWKLFALPCYWPNPKWLRVGHIVHCHARYFIPYVVDYYRVEASRLGFRQVLILRERESWRELPAFLRVAAKFFLASFKEVWSDSHVDNDSGRQANPSSYTVEEWKSFNCVCK